MARQPKNQHVCQQCGFQSLKWLGRCPGCGQWNTLVEETRERQRATSSREPMPPTEPQPIDGIISEESPRLSSTIQELDRVLGGGVTSGSVVMISGDPGIGKSTLLLQALHGFAFTERPILYVSGEESVLQVKMRSQRLGLSSSHLFVAAESALENILQLTDQLNPSVLAVDSIQTVYTTQLESAPGSVSQVRHCADRIMQEGKKTGRPTFLVGHVTKEGTIAGPRVLEHMVDTVLYFEGDRGHAYRILRTTKNRFGSTNEIGVFEMKDTGLHEVRNPSELFLAERPVDTTGSAVTAAIEGTRPILVEIQALASPSSLAVPRRTSTGVDHNRLALLVAVLEKKVGLSLLHQDIFVNVAGGVRIDEPAVDLAIASVVASSVLDKPVDPQNILLGEIGLTGEVRAVGRTEARVKEAAKMGFRRCVLPQSNVERLQRVVDLDLVGVRSLSEVLSVLFE
ncbi:MAG: DNA repair protein RadA [Deltaproteobacteria bacterium]|nr:MAG: DNA repair protein RadA [Deltaproteobacteria bacterium]